MPDDIIGVRIDPELRGMIEKRMEEKGFSKMSDYIRLIIREKVKYSPEEEFRDKLISLVQKDPEVRKLLELEDE